MKSNVQLPTWLTDPVEHVAERTVVADDDRVAALVEEFGARGVRTVRGSYMDSSGVLRAKQAPLARLGAFNRSGLGASNSWAVFAADDLLCMTPSFSAVGDMRLRADLDALVDLGDGVAWVPLDLVDQDGEPMPFCPRQALRRQVVRAREEGVSILGATEVEWTMLDADGATLGGQAYGLSRLTQYEGFVAELSASLEAAGVPLEQLHAEYGPGQFELSVAPRNPLAAADLNTLVKVLISRSARRAGYRASFSPKPFFDAIGNGAHLHLSFQRDGRALLSGGAGPHGLTDEGAAILAAYVAHLPEAAGALASSVLSAVRLQPSTWSGAFACWGLENREAAVRFCAATSGNPHGANVEVKCVDPSANIYAAYAALVGVALAGLAAPTALPAEVTVDPALLSEEERATLGIVLVGADQVEVVDRFEGSALMAEVLGPALVEAMVAVRRHEADLVAAHGLEEIARRFTFAWSA